VSSDTTLLLKIGTYLGGTVAPPDVRRALYLVASRIPGTELQPDVVDAAGRSGSAVVLDGARQDVTLVIDPDTAELLSQTESITLDGVEVRSETTTYLELGVVDATDERP
jgi:hypothetical protein